MRTDPIEHFLARLAAGGPAPGGGASAGLHAAQGAALVAAVARSGDGERSAASPGGAVGSPTEPPTGTLTGTLAAARDAADALREEALRLAAADGDAVAALAAATALPRDDPAEQEHRAAAVAAARREAARVPVRLIALGEEVLRLAEGLRPGAPRSRLPDVAAAAEAVRAAVGTSRVHLEVALVGLVDPDAREELLVAIDPVDDLVLRAAKITAAVREQILR